MISSTDRTATPNSIEITALSKVFTPPLAGLRQMLRRPVKPPVQALRDVTLTVKKGEIFGLIGRNGAGKTTLTKIIATLVQPTSGSVAVNGFDSVTHDRTVREQIGLATAEERSFYWRLTTEQNLMFFARLYGLSDRQARQRIIELFRQLELLPLATRRFSELSTGNKQKLAVARALLARPPVLLLDEPTRSLDPFAAATMRTLIAELAKGDEGVSILLTSHNLPEVEELCDRVAIIADGSIRAMGPVAELRANHRSTERVVIVVREGDLASIKRELAAIPTAVGIDPQDDEISLSLEREVGDEQLDNVLRAVQAAGGAVVSVTSERPSLLDVLAGTEEQPTES
jgi:ABC-2 type transport system ATP-binding protein